MTAAPSPTGPVVLRRARLYGEDVVDVRIRNGRIEAVAAALDGPGGNGGNGGEGGLEVDATGLVLLPGLVDVHTHLRDPGGPDAAENIETGTDAAVAGGYTAVFAMANTDPVADSVEVVEYVARRAAEAGRCDVFPVGALSLGLGGAALAPLEEMAGSRAAVRFFSDDGHCLADSGLVREALRRLAGIGGVLAQHAQCPVLAGNGQANAGEVAASLDVAPWPAVAEETIVARDIVLAREAAHLGARLHVCHASTRGTVELLRWAKQQGLPVTAEVTPHHLALVDSACLGRDTRFKVNPPLRTEDDVLAVREALADGVIDVVATDHAPHSDAAKARHWCDAPPGMLGLETALAVVVETMVRPGRMGWRDVARVMSEAPARIGGVDDRHGRRLAVGEQATLCLVDPDDPWEVRPSDLRSIGRNTSFEGMRLTARVVATLLRGFVAFDRRALFSGPPAG